MEECKQVISVIIPIYNVEPYLRKGLDSLKNQTYQDLEIILVDDGSPDNCPAICDEYAAADPRFKVIHKPNGGVSSARNAGLAAATGDWIGWMDPDDWIEEDMFEYLLTGALANKADIANCGLREHFNGKERDIGGGEECLLDREQGLEWLLQGKLTSFSLYTKLSRRRLWGGVAFPQVKCYEDYAVLWQVLERANAVAVLPGCKYHYERRGGSLMSEISLEKRLEGFSLAREQYERMGEKWPQFEPLLMGHCVSSAIGIWSAYCSNPREVRRREKTRLREIAAFCRANLQKAEENCGQGAAGKLVLRLTPYPRWWAFALAGTVSRLYQSRHGAPL